MSRVREGRDPQAMTAGPPLDSLTSLRFFAALAVVFYHSGSGYAASSGSTPKALQNILDNGWLGVPFFFILSGFILTYAHADLHFDGLQLKRFFLARFARLYPVYLLALLLSVPFVEHFDLRTDWYQVFLLQLWFPGSGATDWNFVAWTLSVELFFYVTFPFARAVLLRLSNAALVGALGGVVVCLIVIWVNMTPQLGDGEWRLGGGVVHLPVPLLRLPEFLYGMMLGEIHLRRVFAVPRAVIYAALLAIVGAAAASTSTAAQTVVILAFGPLILSLANAAPSDAFRRILETRLLVLLGGASYALYLLQFPLRKYVGTLVAPAYSLYARAAFAPALAGASVLVFLYFEGPMRRWLRRALEPAPRTRRA